MQENLRFKIVDIQKLEMDVLTTMKEIIDEKTKVHYLYVMTPNGVAITPLLDKNGNVIID